MNDDILMHVVLQVGCLIIWEREKQRNISWTNMGSCEGGGGEPHREKVVGAQKDIHQHREESSRARGMSASRAKSESFAPVILRTPSILAKAK